MTHPRDIRRLALQMLYQFDARGDEDPDAIRASMLEASDDPTGRYEGPWSVSTTLDPKDHERAFGVASGAWTVRDEADRLASDLAPGWPTSRQPVMDRNVIRLCWYEMTEGDTPPKVAVNEAVELAKEFGTDRSAAFLNGVLDRLMRLAASRREGGVADDALAGSPPLDLPTDQPVADPVDEPHSVKHTEYWSSDP